MTRTASEIGGELIHGFEHAVEHAAHLAASLTKVAAALGISGIAYGVGHLNAELEQTKIGLAAVFQAQGFAGNFNAAFDRAGDQVNKMKQDIKSLPGDLGQLSGIVLTIAGSAAKGGADPDAIRKLAGQALLSGKILGGLPPEQVAREMTMLLAGHAGGRNILAQRMPGIDQHAFTTMTPEARLKKLQELMTKLTGDAAEKFGNSWASVSTTFKDNIKYALLAPATMPLFDAVKRSLTSINTWFDKNKEKVSDWSDRVGKELVQGWDRAIEIADEWWPHILQFARDLHTELEDIWTRFSPALKDAADALKASLGNGTALKKLEDILKLYAATKVGGVVGSASMAGLKIGSSLANIAGAGGGALGGTVATVGAVAAGAMVIIGAGAVGEMHALADSKSKEHAEAKIAAEQFQGATSRFSDSMKTDVMPALDKFGVGLTKFAAWLVDPNSLGGLGNYFGKGESILGMRSFRQISEQDAADKAAESLWKFGLAVDAANFRLEQNHRVDQAVRLPVVGLPIGKSINDQLKELYKKKGAGPGGGGTHIQKVEIVVNSNQDANRVAEMVVDKLSNISRHPKVSQHVPNYSGR